MQKNRQQRIEEYLLDPEKVIFEEVTNFGEAVETLVAELAKIPADVETLKGEDGYTPQKGVDYFTDEEITGLEQYIQERMPKAGADFPTLENARAMIEDAVAKIPKPKNGNPGAPGIPGKPGKNGSPDTGLDIVAKLRELGGNQKLKIKDVRGLPKVVERVEENTNDIELLGKKIDDQVVVFNEIQEGSGGAGEVNVGTNLGGENEVYKEKTGSTLKFRTIKAGANVTITQNADDIEIAAAGGGGGGGGVTDHGALSGLTDDDHTQYALADGSRGSFATTAQGAKADTATQPADLTAGLATKANTSHTHTKSDITDFNDADYATAAQGALAASAMQPGDNISGLTNDSGFQTAAQVTAAVDAVIDSAPGTMDTLNELAASLGDDANFASTMTTALAGKAPTSHTHAASDIASGTLADARVAESNVTQHEAALSITQSQITGLRTETTAASSATLTPTGNALFNDAVLTAQAAALTVAAPSGTAANGNRLIIRIKDNGTARAITWNAIYRVVGTTLPTTTTAGKTMYVGAMYNSTDSKWDVTSLPIEA